MKDNKQKFEKMCSYFIESQISFSEKNSFSLEWDDEFDFFRAFLIIGEFDTELIMRHDEVRGCIELEISENEWQNVYEYDWTVSRFWKIIVGRMIEKQTV